MYLKPVWMIFALFAFGYLFGFVGLLIAVPLATAIWSHHARRGACETGAAGHGAGSGRTGCERNVDHDGAWGSRRNTRERRPLHDTATRSMGLIVLAMG